MSTPTVYVICDHNCKYEGMTKEQILTAIVQAVNSGEVTDIDTGFITTVKTINDLSVKFFYGAQNQYDALSDEEKQNLFAVITDDTFKEDFNKSFEEFSTDFENFKIIFESLKEDLEDGTIVVNSATKATQDGDGNEISTTYLKKGAEFREYTNPNGSAVARTAKYYTDQNLYRVGIALPNGKTVDDVIGVSGVLRIADLVYNGEQTDVYFDGIVNDTTDGRVLEKCFPCMFGWNDGDYHPSRPTRTLMLRIIIDDIFVFFELYGYLDDVQYTWINILKVKQLNILYK